MGGFALLLGLPSLTGGFVIDDKTFFTENDVLPGLRPWQLGRVLLEPSNYWGEHLPARELLFVTERWLFGTQPLGYHAVSCLLYAVLGLLAFRFVQAVLPRVEGGGGARGSTQVSALVVATLFLAHPAHVESFAYVAGQKDLLYSIFSLVSLLVFWRHFQAERPGVGGLVLGVSAYYLACLSKSFGVSLGLLVPLLYLLAPGARRVPPARALGCWAAVQLPVLLWIAWRLEHRRAVWCGTLSLLETSLPDRLPRAVGLLGAHTRLAVLPWKPSFGYPPATGAGLGADFWVGLATLLLCGVLLLALRRRREVVLWVGLYLLTLAPALQLHGGQPNLGVYDRYLCLPLLGLAALIERALRAVTRGGAPGTGARAYAALAATLLFVWSAATLAYLPSFRSDVAVTRNSHQRYPGWSGAAFNHAVALIEAGDLEAARSLVQRDGSLAQPAWVVPYLGGWIDLEEGRVEAALASLRGAARLAAAGGYFPYPNLVLARALAAAGEPAAAAATLRPVFSARIYQPLEVHRVSRLLASLGFEAPAYSPPCP